MKRKLRKLYRKHAAKLQAAKARAKSWAAKLARPALTALALWLAFNVVVLMPQMHRDYLRYSVAPKVYYMLDMNGRSGGTGVHVKAASGKTYLLTNAHVCELAGPDHVLMVTDGERMLPKRVIESSNVTDLCLVEPVEGVDGISLGSEPRVGQLLYAVGHPRLQPTTITEGELVSEGKTMVFDHLITDDASRADCQKPKQKIIKANTFFGEVEVCVIYVNAYNTTIHILGGNSGSPVVDWKGNLVGLVFASDDDIHWGMAITYGDIETFLSAY